LYQQTIRVAANALKGYPNSREINSYYATALEQLGQYKKALTAWQAAAKEDPRSSQVQVAIQRLNKKIEKR
jgi:cytochrome c-type biogenesis protein CcmH/NrfG